ncbi:MAG: hypothetical protein J6386_10170 [Candidatus Synoicihabitans palmerolidicus]|nr:hypothetical protein [Candidatus Synoicihabitans palmerolidicus]
MPEAFLRLLQTPAVEQAQQQTYGRIEMSDRRKESRVETLSQVERTFIAARDSFYLSSVGETGWPYVQHRGGPAGFLVVLDESRLAFAELPGTRQMISMGNVAAEG